MSDNEANATTKETKDDWRQIVSQFVKQTVDNVDDFVDLRMRQLRKRLGWEGVPKILPYIGYANNDFAWFHGRVLTNPPADLPGEDDSWWDNLVNTYQRFNSDEVPGVSVEIDFAGRRHHVVTDKEGYFHLETENVDQVRGSGTWQAVAMRIVDNPHVSPSESMVTSRMLAPPLDAQIGVISDIDDTILHTGITGLVSAAKSTFLHNARTRKPLAGVAALYRALHHGPLETAQSNPIFYVSSSPWNLFDLLEDFMELSDIPAGPILLRDLGFDENKFLKEGQEHKLRKAIKIMDSYPNLPFILFGDSGQEDPQLYSRAATERPQQVKAIFIRDVDPQSASLRDQKVQKSIEKARSVGVPMRLIETSEDAAIDLERMGLISVLESDNRCRRGG